jgi:hypothetical protein
MRGLESVLEVQRKGSKQHPHKKTKLKHPKKKKKKNQNQAKTIGSTVSLLYL